MPQIKRSAACCRACRICDSGKAKTSDDCSIHTTMNYTTCEVATDDGMKRLWKRVKLALGIGRRHYVWFDLEQRNCHEIDYSVTGPDGQPYPPIDCVRVALGEKVKIYRSRQRDTLHACIRGRDMEWDKCYGLFCGSDFDSDNYEFIGTFNVLR